MHAALKIPHSRVIFFPTTIVEQTSHCPRKNAAARASALTTVSGEEEKSRHLQGHDDFSIAAGRLSPKDERSVSLAVYVSLKIKPYGALRNDALTCREREKSAPY